MKTGTCRLTGSYGSYVKAHLIPKALTKPEAPGLPLIQAGSGQRVIKRWSSWYDDQLVTQEGELILADLDTWAIEYLRGSKLVWSGWGPMQSLLGIQKPIQGTDWGFRMVEVKEPHRFRLFLLSLLWRAAASRRFEFSEVTLPPDDLERLRTMLLKGEVKPLAFYPASVVQLSTMGVVHNQSPIAQTKIVPSIRTEPGRSVRIFRFYFDGLVIHFHRQANDDGYTESIGNLIAGAKSELAVTTVPYETSFQRENLINVMTEAYGWPA